MFLGKTLYSHSASIHPGVKLGTGEFNAGEGGGGWDGLSLRWTGIPSRREQKYSSSLHVRETGDGRSPDGPLGHIRTFKMISFRGHLKFEPRASVL